MRPKLFTGVRIHADRDFRFTTLFECEEAITHHAERGPTRTDVVLPDLLRRTDGPIRSDGGTRYFSVTMNATERRPVAVGKHNGRRGGRRRRRRLGFGKAGQIAVFRRGAPPPGERWVDIARQAVHASHCEKAPADQRDENRPRSKQSGILSGSQHNPKHQ